MNTKSMRTTAYLLMIMVASVCVPTSRCRASVEPELTMAVRHKNVPQVQWLLSKGANVNETDEGEEQTPLMWAVQGRDSTLARILLAHGAALDARDNAGNTALMLAVEKGYREIAGILLLKGADANVRNAEGATARSVAQERGDAWVLKLMAQCRQASPRQQARKSVGNRALTLR